MLRQQARLFTKLAISLDSACIAAALLLAFTIIQQYDGRLSDFRDYVWVLLIIVPVWLFLLTRAGLYASLSTKTFSHILAALVKVHLLGGLATSSLVYLIDPHTFSRLLLITFLAVSLFLITVSKGFVKFLLGYYRRKGFNVRYILIVGTGERARNFVDLIRRHADLGLVIAGFVRFGIDDARDEIPDCPCLGNIDDLAEICRQNPIDEVVFSLPAEHPAAIEKYFDLLQNESVGSGLDYLIKAVIGNHLHISLSTDSNTATARSNSAESFSFHVPAR